MGTTIRATCPGCGDVELGVADLIALVCSTTQAASYSFRCPRCRMLVAKETGKQVIDVLISSGVELRTWHMPAELDEPHNGPPLTSVDLSSLRSELVRADWYERLVAAGPGGEGSR